MARARRLEVFQAQFGFYDTVVAAPSQAAALRVWGARQNLFANGQAQLTTDERAVAAALAHPEVPLRRPVGSDGPFELEPKALPKIPDAPRKPPVRPTPGARTAPAPKPAADRTALDAAEAALRMLDEGRKREEGELQRRQEALDAERDEARQAWVVARKAATTAVVEARRAYRRTGGEA
jgi:hypothetical protein